MADWLTPEQRSRNMAAIKSTGTSPELRLGEALRELFPHRHLYAHPHLPGRPDFYLPGFRLAIFVDGCFWHGCPEHGHIPAANRDYWELKLARNMSRDHDAQLRLRELGVRTLRLWEHEVSAKTIHIAMQRIREVALAYAEGQANGRPGPITLCPRRKKH
jgi:DNA mismatch endonuclease (patch repair protein)